MVDVIGECGAASRPLRSGRQKLVTELRQPRPQTRVDRKALVGVGEVHRHFLNQALIRLADFAAPVPTRHQLLGAKCDENAHNDNSDLAGELTPAVQRLR